MKEEEGFEIPSAEEYSKRLDKALGIKKVRKIVVKEIPPEVQREAKMKDGSTARFITIEEALTEIINEEEYP